MGKEWTKPSWGHPGGAGEEEEGDSVIQIVVSVCQPLPEVLGKALAAPPSSKLALAKLPFHLSSGVRAWEPVVF